MGIPGEYYPATRSRLRNLPGQRSGPRKACRAWSGWSWEVPTGPSRPSTQNPPSGPGQPPAVSSLVLGPLPGSQPIGARFDIISYKLSKNPRVSPKSVQKASHTPYFQNGSSKSPLDISRIPYFAAFSHKELMAHFWPTTDFSVKTTKCHPDVHTMSRAKWSSDTPTGPRNKLLLWSRSSSDSARGRIDLFPDILNEVNISLKLGIFWVPDEYVQWVVKRVLNSVKQVLNSVKQRLNSVKPQ